MSSSQVSSQVSSSTPPARRDAVIIEEGKHPSIVFRTCGGSADNSPPANTKSEIAEQIVEAKKRLATAGVFKQGNEKALTMTADLGFYKSPENAESGSSTIRLSVVGGIESIVANMRKHPIDRTLQLDACSTLCNYVGTSAADTDKRLEVVAAGGIELIIDAIRSHQNDIDVQLWACKALSIFACGPDLGEKITEAGMCVYACTMQEGM